MAEPAVIRGKSSSAPVTAKKPPEKSVWIQSKRTHSGTTPASTTAIPSTNSIRGGHAGFNFSNVNILHSSKPSSQENQKEENTKETEKKEAANKKETVPSPSSPPEDLSGRGGANKTGNNGSSNFSLQQKENADEKYKNPDHKTIPEGNTRLNREKNTQSLEGNLLTGIMPKLVVGKPGDKYEVEADSTAETVMRMPEPGKTSLNLPKYSGNAIPQQKSMTENSAPDVQKQENEEPESKPGDPSPSTMVHPKENISNAGNGRQNKGASSESGSHDFNKTLASSRGSGNPLPADVKNFMEPRFGHDFSNVRTHTGSNAHQLSSSINAQAFTSGSDIYFNRGKYSPGTDSGRKLIAHELTHTIQQGKGVRAKHFNITPATPRIQRFLGGLWDKATDFVSSVASSVKEGVSKAANWAKEKALAALNFLKEKVKGALKYIPGYDLLMIVLGQSPPTPTNLCKGVLGLIPVIGPVLFDNLNKSGAITRAFEWLQVELKKLTPKGGFAALFKSAWDQMQWSKGYDYNVGVLYRVFGGLYTKIKNFASAVGSKIKTFILEGALSLVGAPVKTIMDVFNKGKAVIGQILSDPIGFAKNLVKAIMGGFNLFKDNFVTHLKAALANWLFGSLQGTDIIIPEKLDLKGIFTLAASILGLTYKNIRGKIVEKLGPKGEEIVGKIEAGVEFVKDFIARGPIVLWEKVQESLGNLKEMAMNAIIEWVRNTIIFKAVTKLVTMLIPGAGLIEAAMTMYKTVMFFIEKIKEIGALVMGILESIAMIAAGNVGKASKWVENVLAKGLTLLVNFLAKWLGLDKIADKIKEIIAKVRAPVDKALDKVIGWIVDKGKALYAKGAAVVGKVKGKVKSGIEKVKSVIFPSHKFKIEGESHMISIKGEGSAATVYMASNPTPMEAYLDNLKKAKISSAKKQFLEEAIGTLENIHLQTREMKKLTKNSATNKGKINELNNLIEKNQRKLSMKICQIHKGGTIGAKIKHKDVYLMEGTVGHYNMLPTSKGLMERHHMPQKELIWKIASSKLFENTKAKEFVGNEKVRKGTLCLYMGKTRHKETLSYGGITPIAKEVLDMKDLNKTHANDPKKRTSSRKAVIDKTKEALDADVTKEIKTYEKEVGLEKDIGPKTDTDNDNYNAKTIEKIKKQGIAGAKEIGSKRSVIDELAK
ncbi:MAG: DUF4157 domain-containing protein [Nitrospinota bacterium]|nr:DUF4157 domain-containing protein [Nitrospinota bacterium]